MRDTPPRYKKILTRGCFYTSNGCVVVQSARVGDAISTEREPHNPYDSNAIKVYGQTGIHFGYIQREFAGDIAKWMDKGWFFICWVVGRQNCGLFLNLYPIDRPEVSTKAKTGLETESALSIRPLNIHSHNSGSNQS